MDLERLQLGPLPALATRDVGPPLVYLGGLLPIAGIDRPLARRSAEFSARPFADLRRVIYLNRRPGLPEGITFAEIAAEHAEAIAALDAGAVDVIGVSTGGSIAQQLAVDHPEAVRRLVLIATGCRLTPTTRRLQSQVAADIRAGSPNRGLARAALSLFVPGGARLAPVLAPVMPHFADDDLADLAATIKDEDTFDLATSARTITAPTLIAAGTRDRFYPPELLEETQRLIPASTVRLFPRRGHLTAVSDRRLIAAVRGFLAH